MNLVDYRPHVRRSGKDHVDFVVDQASIAVIYNRKERRALGEVVKLLVYSARTEAVAGVPDMRFQSLSVDVLHWLACAGSTAGCR